MTDQNNTVLGEADLAEQLSCPHCGGYARRLPDGVAAATAEQLYSCCWLPGEGAAPAVIPIEARMDLCGAGRQLGAGLLSHTLYQIDQRIDRYTPSDIGTTNGIRDAIWRAVLQLAAQHPAISADLLRLLVDRLEYIEARPVICLLGETPSSARLVLSFRGCGARSQLLGHHGTEIRTLLADLLIAGRGIYTDYWVVEDSRWGSIDANWSIASIEIRERGEDVVLTWPGLQEVAND